MTDAWRERLFELRKWPPEKAEQYRALFARLDAERVPPPVIPPEQVVVTMPRQDGQPVHIGQTAQPAETPKRKGCGCGKPGGKLT